LDTKKTPKKRHRLADFPYRGGHQLARLDEGYFIEDWEFCDAFSEDYPLMLWLSARHTVACWPTCRRSHRGGISPPDETSSGWFDGREGLVTWKVQLAKEPFIRLAGGKPFAWSEAPERIDTELDYRWQLLLSALGFTGKLLHDPTMPNSILDPNGDESGVDDDDAAAATRMARDAEKWVADNFSMVLRGAGLESTAMGAHPSVAWQNEQAEANSPFDVTVDGAGDRIYIEVKCLRPDSRKHSVELSNAQARWASQHRDNFILAVVSPISEPRGSFRLVEPIRDPFQKFLDGDLNVAWRVKISKATQ
jgi:Protein NO VEIN, C-terminal